MKSQASICFWHEECLYFLYSIIIYGCTLKFVYICIKAVLPRGAIVHIASTLQLNPVGICEDIALDRYLDPNMGNTGAVYIFSKEKGELFWPFF